MTESENKPLLIKQTGFSESTTLGEFPEVQRLAKELDYGIEVIGLPGSECEIIHDKQGNIRVVRAFKRLGEDEILVMVSLPPNAPFESSLKPFKEALENLRAEASKEPASSKSLGERALGVAAETVDILAELGRKITFDPPKR